MKKCVVCLQEKPIESFYNYKNSKDGKSYRCKECDNLAGKKWKSENPERARESARERNIKFKYGIDLTEYKELFKRQNEVCAICGVDHNNVTGDRFSKISFAVDHCHTTGKVRGILCNQCNRALGMFKDDVENLKKAMSYLESFKETH